MIKSKPSLYAWLLVAMLCVVACLNYLDRVMITTMRSSIIASIPMKDASFGLLTSVFLWIYGLLSPFAGFLADKFNKSRIIILSLIVWSGVTWLTSYADTFGELLLTRALMGISEACYVPAAMALIMEYHRGPTRSLANSVHLGGMLVGQSLGFLGGWLAESHTWNYAFGMFGIIGIAYAALLCFTLRDPRHQEEKIDKAAESEKQDFSFIDAIKKLFANRNYLLALSAWGCLGVVGFLIVGWLPTYYKEHFNLSQTMAGVYATGYFHTAGLVGVLVGGALADFWSRSNSRARILVPVLGLCIAVPSILIASNSDVLIVTVTAFLVFAFTRIFVDSNMMPILCLVTDTKYRATGYGVLNLFSCLIGGIGLYAGGYLRDAHVNLSYIFQAAAGLLLISAFLLYFIKPTAANPNR